MRSPGFVLSIGAKGVLVFAALMAYSIVIAFFLFHEKQLLLRDFEEIQQSLETEALLTRADASTFHALMAVFANLDATDPAARLQRIGMHHQTLLHRHAELMARLPRANLGMDALTAAWAAANRDPSRANMNRMLIELVKIKSALGALNQQSLERRRQLSEHYRSQSNSVTMTTLSLGLLCLLVLGVTIGLFFRRLTLDLGKLQARALDIVNGYRGAPIPVTRRDEVGQLIAAVNGMVDALDTREKELLVERQKYFHQEKMAAIGALAAGVAHEIGNPIAAISGVAQEIGARKADSPETCRNCRPELIYAQTQRLSMITREISDFASPQATEPQFLDLNGQLRSISSLIRYDKRLRRVTLKLDLDAQLPAIYGVADQLTQLIMNLLINAMDALAGVEERVATATITTRSEPERVRLTVEDNGHGMDPATLRRVFEAFFTTKAAGKGTGLGLSLCYSIMKRHGGSIEIESTPQVGTRVQVLFPLTETAYNEAN
ncbi:MAG: HAMP domain-containing protein [Burkholderiaceae bacterium]|nr:HAMP domain-containing protein [Burkholderiaceae bacterium]